jgi:hypothetical protein
LPGNTLLLAKEKEKGVVIPTDLGYATVNCDKEKNRLTA